MISQKNSTYYDVLDISKNATTDEIRMAYMRAKTAYQDTNAALYSIVSENECKDMLSKIEEAYDILSNPTKKKQYDLARNIDQSPTDKEEEKTDRNLSFDDDEKRNLSTSIGNSLNSGKSITKLVAKQRFTLNYSINSEIEKEIEQTSEFTGPFLKKIRDYKGVDINRMSEMTKVSKTYILNIEEENFPSLPAEVYVRGFVYQYAKCLKLNPDLVATSYLHRVRTAKNKTQAK